MKMNLKAMKFWMLLMPLALGMASCSDDESTTPSSIVDNKTWDESSMDKTVKAGDNFYMYCNGTFWKNTDLGESSFVGKMFSEAENWISSNVALLDIPTKKKMLQDAEKSDQATIDQQDQKLLKAIGRVNACSTKEDVWKVIGQLMNEGYRTPFETVVFAKNGKMAVALSQVEEKDYEEADELVNSLAWRLANDPQTLASVRPLKGTTRGSDFSKWPMHEAIFKALGFPLEYAYTIDNHPHAIVKGVADSTLNVMSQWQNMDVEKLKANVIGYMQLDAVFYDDEAFERILPDAEFKRLATVNNFLGRYLKYETSRAFAQKFVTSEMKERTRGYCEALRQTFRERILKNDWMSEGSKQNAIEKLNAMTFNIGAPEEWFEEGIADVSQEATLLDDILNLRRTQLNLQRKLVGMEIAKASFHHVILMNPLTTANAFYVSLTNSMNIYPVWMMKPYYDPQQNDAHNYATMSVFGHEITHGFDAGGALYSKDGDLKDIWASQTDRDNFAIRTGQLVGLYCSFEVLPGLFNDGQFTVEENAADLGGFCLAYDTYVKHLEQQGFKDEQLRLQKQRFYEGYGILWCGKWNDFFARVRTSGMGGTLKGKDEHSLFTERVNGVVMNTDDWYDLFGVKEGDKLYLRPESRVRIW